MKFTCPHCGKAYDVAAAKPNQKAKCKSCEQVFSIANATLSHYCTGCKKSYTITPELVGKTVTCPDCGMSETGQASSQPLLPREPSTDPLLQYCPCGIALHIQPDQVNDYLRCPCGRQIVVPGSRLYYLRSLRRMGLFFMWIAIISLIIAFFQALSSSHNY